MERPLSEWERSVVSALAGLTAIDGDVVRESLPHLVVTGGCECGCASYNLTDIRYPRRPHHLRHFSNGVAKVGDVEVGFVLWLGPDGRPISVDVDPVEGRLPDATDIEVSPPGP